MTSAELERVEMRMKKKWHELVVAEQQGASMPVLERMYNMYMLAVEEYNRCRAELQQEEETSQQQIVQEQARQVSPAPTRHNKKKKAS